MYRWIFLLVEIVFAVLCLLYSLLTAAGWHENPGRLEYVPIPPGDILAWRWTEGYPVDTKFMFLLSLCHLAMAVKPFFAEDTPTTVLERLPHIILNFGMLTLLLFFFDMVFLNEGACKNDEPRMDFFLQPAKPCIVEVSDKRRDMITATVITLVFHIAYFLMERNRVKTHVH